MTECGATHKRSIEAIKNSLNKIKEYVAIFIQDQKAKDNGVFIISIYQGPPRWNSQDSKAEIRGVGFTKPTNSSTTTQHTGAPKDFNVLTPHGGGIFGAVPKSSGIRHINKLGGVQKHPTI